MRKLPPGETAKFTESLPAFSNGASTLGAAPNVQNPVVELVSQIPPLLLSNRREVTVRVFAPLGKLTVNVGSRLPSAPCDRLFCLTRSRSGPLYTRAIGVVLTGRVTLDIA